VNGTHAGENHTPPPAPMVNKAHAGENYTPLVLVLMPTHPQDAPLLNETHAGENHTPVPLVCKTHAGGNHTQPVPMLTHPWDAPVPMHDQEPWDAPMPTHNQESSPQDMLIPTLTPAPDANAAVADPLWHDGHNKPRTNPMAPKPALCTPDPVVQQSSRN